MSVITAKLVEKTTWKIEEEKTAEEWKLVETEQD